MQLTCTYTICAKKARSKANNESQQKAEEPDSSMRWTRDNPSSRKHNGENDTYLNCSQLISGSRANADRDTYNKLQALLAHYI